MKSGCYLIAIVIVLLLFLFPACEGPQGPAGPAGSPNVRTVLSVHRSSNQSIPDSTETTVLFDQEGVDAYDAYDPTTGEFTVPETGDYAVTFCIDWVTLFSAFDLVSYRLQINDSVEGGIELSVLMVADQDEARTLSRSLPNLSSGDVLKVAVYQGSGTSNELVGTTEGGVSYLTIDRLK